MASPPSYAPSLLPPPVYTLFPQSHEETLCKSTALAGPTELRDAQITVGEAFGSVTFTSQARGTIMPSYGRGSSVEGIVRLRHIHRVCAVKLKLAGNVRLTSPEGGEDTLPFFERDYLLWTATDPSTQAPATHSFFIPLPADIDDDGALRPLPPSFSAAFDDLTVNVEYRCTVTIHQNRTFLGLVSALKISTPFSYKPRSRPQRPSIGAEHTFISTVKVAPDDWAAVGFHVDVQDPAGALDCEIAFPSPRAFAALQRIPFHVQVCGQPQCLSYFSSSLSPQLSPKAGISGVGPTLVPRLDGTDSQGTAPRQSSKMDVFVTVERRIVANALSGTFYQLQQLSKIKLRPVHVNVADGWITWDGELELSDFDTSGFRIGPLTVSDYIVFAVRGRSGASFRAKDISIPIRLVTDPFPPT